LKDEELILRFLSFYLKGWQNYKGKLNSFLNDTLENFNKYEDKLHNIEQIFNTTMENIQKVFGDKPFTIKKEGRYGKKPNASLFDILTVSFAIYDPLTTLEKNEQLLEQFNILMSDNNFLTSITLQTLTKSNVNLRFEKWFNVMDKHVRRKADDPSVYS
jgi:hypothetical protein